MKVLVVWVVILLAVRAPLGSTSVIQTSRNMTPCWEDAVFCFGKATGCKGLIDAEGELIRAFEVELQSVGGFYEGLMKASYPGKGAGFVDTEGRWAIDPRFETAKRFSGGLAPARMDNLWGYIDRVGEWAIEPRFDGAEPFSADGLARVYVGAWNSEERRAGFIDRRGNWAVEPALFEAKDFSGGVAWAITEGPCWTDRAFSSGIPPLWDVYGGDPKWKGYEIVHPKDEGIPACSWRVIDTSGRPVSETGFEAVGEFSDGLAPVKINGRWDYVDARGVRKIPARYASARPFAEGLAAVQEFENGLWSYIDTDGAKVLDGYLYAGDFQDGLAIVEPESARAGSGPVDAGYLFIDRSGDVVVDPAPRGASSFCNGLSNVAPGGAQLPFEASYIDKEGRTVFRWTWTL